MAKAIAAWDGGIHGRIQIGLRGDGVVFRRFQEKGRYGYQWGKWKQYDLDLDVDNPPGSIEQGFSTCYPPSYYVNWKKWRLPNDPKGWF